MSRNEFKNIKILFVEDEENIRANAISYLKRLFDEVYEAKDAFEAFEIVQYKKPHIIITASQIHQPHIIHHRRDRILDSPILLARIT